jgi:N-acetylglucosaminyldiphosphoundecaprenol N-acetyl-beta-D-mannosaminyltransferase
VITQDIVQIITDHNKAITLNNADLELLSNNRVDILGVKVNSINMQQAISMILYWVINRIPRYVCVTAAHVIMDTLDSSELRSIYEASGMTAPDGMSLVWFIKLKRHKHVSRVYGPDLLLNMCEATSSLGFRHYFYGAKPGVADQLVLNLKHKYPDLQIAGTFSPPFGCLTPEEDQSIISRINATNPDIVWVGLSNPKQDRWIASHVGKLNAPVLIAVGAAFDFLSGNKKQAPKWIQNIGFEWLFRLCTEPRRLWRRYARYPKFVILAVAQLIGIKR